MQHKLFYLACFGFVAGVLVRSFFHIDGLWAVLVALVSLFPIAFLSLLVSRKEWGIYATVLILALSLGILRFHLADNPPPAVFENLVNQKTFLSGILTDEPDVRENGVKLTIATGEGHDATKILLSLKSGGDYVYGDELQVSGILEKPKNFLTDQGTEFDYVHYLRTDGILYVMHNPKVQVISHGHGTFIKSTLYGFKQKFDAAVSSAMTAPESVLLGALILGERSSLSQSLRQAFITTGTIHIVTISGYNVTLVAGWVMKMLAFLPLYFATGAGIFSIFLYVLITGGAQTAVRAGIMAVLALLAKTTGRLYGAGHALTVTGIVMVAINPFILAFDVSFELSFLATVAVIFLSPKVLEYFYWIRWNWLRDIVSITCSAYMFVLPFILYKMGNLSLIALPTNIAVLPFIPATMIVGFATGFIGLFSNTLAIIPGEIAYILLHGEIIVVDFFSRLPFAALSIPNFPLWLVVLVYALFFWALFREKSKEEALPAHRAPQFPGLLNIRFFLLATPLLLTLIAAGFLYYPRYVSNKIAKQELQTLLADVPTSEPPRPFEADARTKGAGCVASGGLPDHACTPGAVFEDATPEHICVKGYTKDVRNVPTSLRKKVYAEYGVSYPEPRGAYEVDHLVPLALAGSNDIANLFLEAAAPVPGFHEKDLVEVYLQEEVCSHRVVLSVAQRQAAVNWLAVYTALSPEQLAALRRKYGGN